MDGKRATEYVIKEGAVSERIRLAFERRDGKKPPSREVGLFGEDVACVALGLRGYEVMERNWRCPFGEADIVALDGEVRVLLEVKARVLTGSGEEPMPEIAVGQAKRRRYQLIASDYLAMHPSVHSVRFDVAGIGIMPDGTSFVRYLENAYGWDD